MIEIIRTLFNQRRLLRELVVRDLKARYIGSSMGFFWSVIYPIINLFVYMFVFSLILKVRFDDQSSTSEVAIWMLAGIVVWAAFAETLSRSTNCLVENANLIQKVVFPSSVLPVYLTISSLINMTIGLPIVLAGVTWIGYISPPDAGVAAAPPGVAAVEDEANNLAQTGGEVAAPENRETEEVVVPTTDSDVWIVCTECDYKEVIACPHGPEHEIQIVKRGVVEVLAEPEHQDLALGAALLALPLLLLVQGLFTVGLGLFLSSFNLILRDTFHLVGVATMVWMFSTPIFYPPQMVLTRNDGAFSWILDVNPMYWLITCYRDILLFNTWPDPMLLGRFAVVGLIVFWIGATFFKSQRDRFPDLL